MYYCIVNPVAGRGEARDIVPLIETFMLENNLDFTIKITSAEFEAVEFAKEAVACKSEAILGVGGDGTLQEIVTGMLATGDSCQVPLSIIPCGSGDDFTRTVFKKSHKTIDSLQALLSGRVKHIDAIRANDLVCLNIANIGLDAQIVYNAQGLKKKFVQNAYLIAATISIFRHKNIDLEVFADDTKISGKFTLAAVCNARYYGGGFEIAPMAKIDDGSITLCLVDAMPGIKALFLFPIIMLKRHTNLKVVRYIDCSQVSLKIYNTQTFSIDGNLYQYDKINFKILPKAIQIFV